MSTQKIRSRTYRLRAILATIALLVGVTFVSTLVASPAQAVGSYDNAEIADYALTFDGQQKGECRAFVNEVVAHVSGGTQSINTSGDGYFDSFLREGGQRITDYKALVKGDIVQLDDGSNLHTWIIVSRNTDGSYTVVDSNHLNDDGIVRVYSRTQFTDLSSTTRAYRMGTVLSSQPAGAMDANPTITLSNSTTLLVQHTARDGRATTRLKTLNGPGYASVQTGSSTSWSTRGTSDIAMDPSQNGVAWTAIVKDAGDHGELYLFQVTSSGSTNIARLDVGSETDQWSLNAPPSIVVDSEGNVYVAAVQADGDMSVFKRNGSTGNIGRTSIGNAAAWSMTGTVSLAVGPDDAIWLAAATKQSVNEVRTYRGEPHLLSFSSYGKVGVDNWTVNIAPAIVVDNDGDVTVAAVKTTGAMWTYHNVDGQNGNWVKVDDDVGAVQTWSVEGTMNLAVNGDDTVYVAGVQGANSNGGELQVFTMTPNATVADSVWMHDEQIGTGSDWSPYSAPDIISTSVGTVFLVAVQADGELYAFVRNHSNGAWSNYGQIGGSGWTGA
jgi:hypothetical protein